jgi:hypothetical protein
LRVRSTIETAARAGAASAKRPATTAEGRQIDRSGPR